MFGLEDLLANQVFVGVSSATMLGSLMYLLRELPWMVWRRITTVLSVELEVTNSDVAFYWLVLWLSRQPYSQRARRLRLSSEERSNFEQVTPAAVDEEPKPKEYLLSPGFGQHFFWHGRTPIWMGRSEKDSKEGLRPREVITLRALARSRASLEVIVTEAAAMANVEKDRGLSLYGHDSYYTNWNHAGHRRFRPTVSVVLQNGIMDTVLTDVAGFLTAGDWYADRGIPWHRGYLLFGPPGCGKTSLITAVASHFKMGIAIMHLSSVKDDGTLNALFRSVPKNTLLMIEDVDVAFRDRQDRKEEGPTFAGLLNAIDGVGSAEGLVMFMTTNHRELLDPALVRPGRADLSIHIGEADADQGRRMFLRFFEDELAAVRFGRAVEGMAPAKIQGILVENRDDADAALTVALDREAVPA